MIDAPGVVWRSGFAIAGMMYSKRGHSARTPETGLFSLAEPAGRVLITINTDFGELIYLHDIPHAGLVRLPDVPAEQRIAMMSEVVERHGRTLENRAIVTIRGGRIRISEPPTPA